MILIRARGGAKLTPTYVENVSIFEYHGQVLSVKRFFALLHISNIEILY